MKDMRLLKLYNRLLKNDDIDVEEYAKENGVSTRTVERDIKCIKDFLADNEDKSRELIRIKRKKKYQLSYSEDSVNLTKSEILAISKILLASRAFLKDEISLIIDKIVKQLEGHGMTRLGEKGDVTPEVAREIVTRAL